MAKPGPGRFIGERVSVELREPDIPSSFTWHGRVYTITSIESHLRRVDRRREWYRRRHRDYFLVRVDTGQLFELYHHRIPGKPYWVLMRELASRADKNG